MKPIEIKAQLGNLPYMTLARGQQLFDFLVSKRLTRCLELGFYHGVSSCYIAGALEEQGSGNLVTIDLLTAQELTPNIAGLLESLRLTSWVTPCFEAVSYNWRLMHFLEEGRSKSFDFCYIDGGHTWETTGFAFFLVTKLLRQGGWILFDDLQWTHSGSATASKRTKNLPGEFRDCKQVEKVFELLVRNDSQYANHTVDGQWGFAQKV